jgi:hypothetical protein
MKNTLFNIREYQKPWPSNLANMEHPLANLGNGLKALFVFNQTVRDATGNCGLGTLVNDATFKPHKVDADSPTGRGTSPRLGRGPHLYLDGTGDYVDIPNEQCQAINFGVKDFTIFTRFFPDDPTPNDEIRIFNFGGPKRYELLVATLSKVEFNIDDDVTKTTSTKVSIYKQWHEVVVQREYGTSLRIRRNLIDAGWNSVADNTGDITTTDDFQFGTNKFYGTSPKHNHNRRFSIWHQ